MGEIAAATGGDTPRALAKQAVAAGHAPKDVQPESAIQQLVILWERAVKKN